MEPYFSCVNVKNIDYQNFISLHRLLRGSFPQFPNCLAFKDISLR